MDIEAEISQLRAEREITAALHRYARGADRRDIDLMRSVYHADATDVRGEGNSAAALLDTLADLLAKYERTMHCLGNIEIELHGDTATVQSYVRALHLLTDDSGQRITIERNGRFLDRFERRGGEWRIAARGRASNWNEQRTIHPAP